MRLRAKALAIVFVLLLVGLAALWARRSTLDRYVGYFAPVFTPDAAQVCYVQRSTSGRSWGLGWEHFTPPANVRVAEDRFSLRCLELSSGREQVLREWPPSPLEGREERHYRGRLYGFPMIHLRFHPEAAELEYQVAIARMTQPLATNYRVYRIWDDSSGRAEGSDEWVNESRLPLGLQEDRLRGALEVMEVPGKESFPCAIVIVDHDTGELRTLRQTDVCDELYPDGVPERIVQEKSRREEIERLRSLRQAYAEAVAEFRAQGLSEGEARLKANKRMQELGFYPKSPTLRAQLLDGPPPQDGIPLFEIAAAEMASGIFQDIEAAIAVPGSEVDKNFTKYVRHRDYDTSERLNAFLAGGDTVFRLRYEGRLYEMTIRRYDRR